MRIRVAEESDAEALRAYAEVLFAEDLPGIYRREAPSLEDERAFIRSHVAPANSTLMVAEEDGRIVGIIGFLGHDLPDERHAGEFGLSVAEGYRGRGIGTALIEALLAWAPSTRHLAHRSPVVVEQPRCHAPLPAHGVRPGGIRSRGDPP